MRKKELQTIYDEISELIQESSSVPDYIRCKESLQEIIKGLIVDRKQWINYALDAESDASRYRQAIVHALSIPDREWTKEKISTILKQALGDF